MENILEMNFCEYIEYLMEECGFDEDTAIDEARGFFGMCYDD